MQILKLFSKYTSKIVSETIIHKTNKKKKTLLLWWTWRKWRKWFLCYRNSKTSRNQNKRIIYRDEIDGIPEYEPDLPTEEELEEDNNYEIQNKYKGKQPKQIEKPKKVKKGITKSIKL